MFIDITHHGSHTLHENHLGKITSRAPCDPQLAPARYAPNFREQDVEQGDRFTPATYRSNSTSKFHVVERGAAFIAILPRRKGEHCWELCATESLEVLLKWFMHEEKVAG